MSQKNDADILFNIAQLHSTGRVENEGMGAMLSAFNGNPIIQEKQSEIGVQAIHNVTDTGGDVLVAGENYLLEGKKVKVLREEFGAGNFMNTYYSVYYFNSDLDEVWEVVDNKFPEGAFGRRTYPSKFKKIAKKEI